MKNLFNPMTFKVEKKQITLNKPVIYVGKPITYTDKVPEGYEGYYDITRDGRVWSWETKKFMKFGYSKSRVLDKNGECKRYNHITLSKKGSKPKQYKINRLMLFTYRDLILGKNIADHIVENTLDDRICNLQWLTPAENVQKIHARKANREAKRHKMKSIQCIETGKVFDCVMDAARGMNLNSGNLSKHLNDPKHVHSVSGYTFKFI